MSSRAWLLIAIVAGSAYSQTSDVTPPTLLSFSFGPASIDTRAGPQDMIFTADVSDDLSGVEARIAVILAGPTSQRQRAVLVRTSGTALLGTYTATFSFPQFTEPGPWRVDGVRLFDLAVNIVTIGTETLKARGFPTSLQVASIPDITPPQIQSLEFTPATLNVSAAPATVRVRMRLVDTQTELGIEGTFGAYDLLILTNPSGNQPIYLNNNVFRLVSGTRSNGIWEGSFVMPRYAASGIWRIERIRIRDTVDNVLNATESFLAAAGLASGVTVTGGPTDTTIPTLSSLAISPASIDPSLTRQTVSVTFGVQDNLSGVDFVPDPICPCEFLGIVFTSPSGGQFAHSLANPFTQIGGSDSNGTWRGSVVFPRFAEAGTWKGEVFLKDRARNQRRVSADQLRAAGFPSSLVVIRPSYVPDGTAGPGQMTTVADQIFGSQAQLTIPATALAGDTQVSIDVLETVPNIPIPQGFSAMVTRFVNIDFVPHPAPIASPGYTLTIPLVNPLPPATSLILYRFDPVLGTLHPARGVSAAEVTGTVDPSSITATFAGIASFSTVVGLLPSAQKPGDVNGDNVINCADVSIVRAAFGKRTGQPGFNPRADINRDGIVNVSDLSFVLKQLPAGSSCQ